MSKFRIVFTLFRSPTNKVCSFDMDYNPQSLIKLTSMKMPYGKYQGVTLIDLPEQYVVWYYDNGLPKGEIGKLLAELYDIKVNGLEPLIKSLKLL